VDAIPLEEAAGPDSRLRESLRRFGVTITTPFSRDGRHLDLSGLEANVRWLVKAGVQLIYPCGNTGEFSALSLDEWTRVLERTITAAGGVAVVPGIGGAWHGAREMVTRAAALGADGVLLMPLNYPYVSEEGSVDYYSTLADNPAVPAVLYRRSNQLSANALQTIVSRGNIASIKFATHDMVELASLIKSTSPALIWGCGLAETWAPFYALAGARGFTSGLANFAPQRSLSLADELRRDDFSAAFSSAMQVMPFEAIRSRNADKYNVSAVKYAMDLAGLAGGSVRPPLSKVDAAAKLEIRAVINGWLR